MAASLGSVHAADVVLAETFNDVTTLASAGWVFTNNSVSAGQAWTQGNAGIFPAAAGAASSFVAASFLSTTAATGAVSNWLLTPVLTLNSSSELVFLVRNAGENFLDQLEVRFSSAGSSTNVGSTAASVGDFTTVLRVYSSSTDNGWLDLTYTFSNLPVGTTSGRIGFRYVIGDVATQGNYLGLDSVVVTGVAAVPEPATYALFGLGIAGLALLRRRHATSNV